MVVESGSLVLYGWVTNETNRGGWYVSMAHL